MKQKSLALCLVFALLVGALFSSCAQRPALQPESLPVLDLKILGINNPDHRGFAALRGEAYWMAVVQQPDFTYERHLFHFDYENAAITDRSDLLAPNELYEDIVGYGDAIYGFSRNYETGECGVYRLQNEQVRRLTLDNGQYRLYGSVVYLDGAIYFTTANQFDPNFTIGYLYRADFEANTIERLASFRSGYGTYIYGTYEQGLVLYDIQTGNQTVFPLVEGKQQASYDPEQHRGAISYYKYVLPYLMIDLYDDTAYEFYRGDWNSALREVDPKTDITSAIPDWTAPPGPDRFRTFGFSEDSVVILSSYTDGPYACFPYGNPTFILMGKDDYLNSVDRYTEFTFEPE